MKTFPASSCFMRVHAAFKSRGWLQPFMLEPPDVEPVRGKWQKKFHWVNRWESRVRNYPRMPVLIFGDSVTLLEVGYPGGIDRCASVEGFSLHANISVCRRPSALGTVGPILC